MTDAEAICEAAVRRSMRFVSVKREDVQGAAMLFRVHELLIRPPSGDRHAESSRKHQSVAGIAR